LIQEKCISIEEAAKIAEQDLLDIKGTDHLKPLKNALKWLTGNQKDNQSQGGQ